VTIAPVVTVQNLYNLANRQDDALVARCAEEGIAFAPFFPSAGSRRCSPACSTR
jgi:pyridoxine 4-dehydrogenase